ncbi:NAD(P)H-dependent flavin oxidoreductase [Streptomyces sp. NPDC058439]|uniref:NAD(P)H-dependent flavin oxidoreductase n=1 Tax=Streptomyces sp. NPDC058439 TaxID=3346500 RepID=UPI00365FF684
MGALTTAVCTRLGIEHPVVQAPIGSAATPELAAAVSAAGGLGSLALTWTSPPAARSVIRRVRELTDRPFAVNLVLDFEIGELLRLCLDERVPVISTFWGDPTPVASQVHASGALHLHTVGSVDEADTALAAGVDGIVAQGWEAGGHVRGEVSTMALVPAVVDRAGPVPVLAAGGIADGRGLAAALALGAQGAWMGTRFLAARESASHRVYREALLGSAPQDASYTRCFDGGWPHAPHRALRNSTMADWEAAGCPPAPDRPGEGTMVATDGEGGAHHRYDDTVPLSGMSGDLEALALYAGQSVGLVNNMAGAAEIVTDVVAHARRLTRVPEAS